MKTRKHRQIDHVDLTVLSIARKDMTFDLNLKHNLLVFCLNTFMSA